MNNKEQIMIDGVDVSGCEYLKYDKIGCYADDCTCPTKVKRLILDIINKAKGGEDER